MPDAQTIVAAGYWLPVSFVHQAFRNLLLCTG